MVNRRNLSAVMAGGFFLLAFSCAVCAQTLQVDRGLPHSASSGARRTGVRLGWIRKQDALLGDDFALGKSGETWVINRIRLWALVPGQSNDIRNLYKTITLYGGLTSEPIRDDKARQAECECHGLTALKTVTLLTGNTSATPDVTFTPVNYPDGSTYQEHGKTFSLWQIEFQNLRWSVPGGGVVFAIRSEGRGSSDHHEDRFWFYHGSQVSGRHRLRVFDERKLPEAFFDEAGGITERAIGINVQVWAYPAAANH